MLGKISTRERGDTIIEVLLAVAVFSLVAVGALVVMNQGTNASQRALELTLVKQQVDSQAEALRAAQQEFFIFKSNGGGTPTAAANPSAFAWTQAKAGGNGTVAATVTKCPTGFPGVFAMNIHDATYTTSLADAGGVVPYAQAKYSGTTLLKVYGIWITRKPISGFTPTAYDFTIHACWYGPGSQVPMQIQTVVRLYDAA